MTLDIYTVPQATCMLRGVQRTSHRLRKYTFAFRVIAAYDPRLVTYLDPVGVVF
jgi:hypothetical protein